jgi:hypothetical protein
VDLNARIVQPATPAPLMTLSEAGTTVNIDAPFREVDATTTDQTNDHPQTSLEMTLICPRDGLIQKRLQLMMKTGGSHGKTVRCGNFYSKPKVP